MNAIFRPHRPPSLADHLRDLGDIPPDRVRWSPRPGTATIADLLKPENSGCELVDGTLVEKPMGWEESSLGLWLGMLVNQHVVAHNLGVTAGEQGMYELPGDQVRGPDLSFCRWDSLPDRRRPAGAYPRVAPDLVVEILSPSNTLAEMARKRGEYFRAGVRLVWEIDPRARTITEYTADDAGRAVDTLDGRDVLPGFAVSAAQLFAELDRRG